MNLPSFEEFFYALWGHEPFPWQKRLSDELVAGQWPEWITLPTGTGKTSTLDIAIYALARQAYVPANERSAPVRIVFAVNRRIVVDEAFERVKKIASALKVAVIDSNHVLHEVAKALQFLAGDGAPPLEAYPLRGATYTDHAWTRSATQPLVVTTTLDQLGSRLLFRGYGCSIGARPMHAALLTNDALLLLDEAHTSRAFSETLTSVAHWREQAPDKLRLPFSAVQLTATPPQDAKNPFQLDQRDKIHPVIAARLSAKKPTSLLAVQGATGKDRHKKLATACETIVNKIAADVSLAQAKRVLIVVNRVATASQIHQTLLDKMASQGYTVELLTGGMRPLDRDSLISSITQTFYLQSSNPPSDVPKLILVSTQCIEVGADFDFDALITELAPIDAIRQRFGRLNRYGRNLIAPAWIFAPEEALASAEEKKADPLYGTCLPAVWQWLCKHETGLDLGLGGFDAIRPLDLELSSMLAPAPLAPVLLPAHLDLFCQTSPAPHYEPEPSLYIHGPQRDYPTVSVVIRNLSGEHAIEVVQTLPPLSTEAATLTLQHVRRWLQGDRLSTDSDAPSNNALEPQAKSKADFPMTWKFSGNSVTQLESPEDLQSGDVLIIPHNTADLSALLPGLASDSAQLDQLEMAHLLSRDKLLLELSNQRLRGLRSQLSNSAKATFDEILVPLHDAEEVQKTEGDAQPFCKSEWKNAFLALLQLFSSDLAHPIWQIALRPSSVWLLEPHPAGGVIARNAQRVGFTAWPLEPDEIGRQGNSSLTRQSLVGHQAGVEDRLKATLVKLGFDEEIQSSLIFAARYHDIGKADPRFQAWLHGCTIWQSAGRELIAKSIYAAGQFKRFQALSEIPQGFRHELISTLIVAQSSLVTAVAEADLMLHLIASHHGYCRGSAPVVIDLEPESITVEVEGQSLVYEGRSVPLANFAEGVPERFWTLTRRFGWWGIAYLETLLRLADQRESASPSQQNVPS